MCPALPSPPTNTVTYPALPTGLVIQILLCACSTSHETALDISLVSSWIRPMTLPYVFSTIVRRASQSWALPMTQRGFSHLLPPPRCGQFVRFLWLESVDMLASPGELSIFNACPNIEDVACSARSLRVLYTSLTFGTQHSQTSACVSRIRSITLLQPTFGYDWHFLTAEKRQGESHFLQNVTHLRLLDMQQSSYIPIEHFPHLTHLALPYLNLRTNRIGDIVRIPDSVAILQNLKMIILTVDEKDWLYKPWAHRGASLCMAGADSPRERFRVVMQRAQEKDARIHLVLSPGLGRDACIEWTTAAEGGENIWERAARVGHDDSHSDALPNAFPSRNLRYTTMGLR